MSNVRVRFAPSPTGFLHVGGARTALFNFLFARHHGGVFVLRIEDTDRNRSDEAMTQAILDSMVWMGLHWDEGPHHQADGFLQHRDDAVRLLESGAAYRCFCTQEELEGRRAAAGDSGDAYRYDLLCRRIDAAESERRAAAGEMFTVRFRVTEGVTAWDDAVHGRIEVANDAVDDFIILRSDGTPIYNMAVVSDDIAMQITHVIRGDDHISNTPKQILLYQALAQPLPVFAHVPMILGSDGKRLSKRHGATAVGEYEKQGILPEAMANFLALLGWSPGEDREIMEMEEMIRRFSLEEINSKSAVFDTRKLEWMNGQYISSKPAEELFTLVLRELVARGLATEDQLEQERAWWLRLIDLLKVRARYLSDIAEQALPYVKGEPDYDPEAVARHWKDAGETRARMGALRRALADAQSWDEVSLEAVLRTTAEQLGIGAGKLIHPLRVALLGTAVSPGIFDVLVALGRERALQRIDRAVQSLEIGAAS